MFHNFIFGDHWVGNKISDHIGQATWNDGYFFVYFWVSKLHF